MKSRAGGASLAVETRRLLRHLDAPKRLRRNTLVSYLFDEHSEDVAMAAIRAVVHRALDALVDQAHYAKKQRALRLREIVTRFDLNGEPSYVVATELGLSLRHFYRERNAACLEIGALLGRLLPQRRPAINLSSLYEVAEAAAHGMILTGAPEQAAVQFLSLAAEVNDPRSRIAALCDAAAIMIELYDSENAAVVLAEAIATLERSGELSPAAWTEARSIIDFTRALTLWDANATADLDHDHAASLAFHTMERAHRYMNELSASGLRFHAGERMRYAGRRVAQGDPTTALRLLHDSEPFIDLLGQRVPFLRVDYANLRCGIEMRTAGPFEEAAQLASSAYEESRKQGYLIGAATAARSMAMMLARQQDGRAAEFAETLLQFSRRNNSPRLTAYAQLGAAEVYTLLGDYDRALALTCNAVELLHGEPAQVRRARLLRAKALRGLRGPRPKAKLPS